MMLAVLSMTACKTDQYKPEQYITKDQEQKIIYSVMRYSAKLAPRANHDTKFDAQFDPYYQAVATDYDIRAYYIGPDSTHYILFTRAARSITPMRESIGCKIKYAPDGSLTEYEEVFRTWKMPEETMNERFPILFEKMKAGESLEPYYPKNTGDQYIEFPDGRFYFDKEKRRWRDTLMDSLNLTPQVNNW